MLFQHTSPVECRSCVVYAQDSILCQFGPRNLSSVQQPISQPILVHFWWELYQNTTATPSSYALYATGQPRKLRTSSKVSSNTSTHEDSALAYTPSTMKPPPSYAITSTQRTWNTNLYHHISTDGMPPNAPSKPSRTISLPVSRAPTPTSPFRTGAASYPRPNSPLISSAPLASIPNFPPMPNSRVPLISHAHPSHPQEPESSSTKTHQPPNLGPTWHGWLVPWPSPPQLSMLSRLGTTHPRRTHRRHHLFLPKSRRTSQTYPQRRHDPSRPGTHPGLTTTTFSRTTRPIP